VSDLGRQVKYGIGKETTAGTAVAASNWVPQLKFSLNPMRDYAVNESAFGRVEKSNSADITKRWAEGDFEAKLTDKTSGYILLGAFGSVSTAANADASTLVKDHTFTINQDINGQSFTLVRKDSIATEAFALARFDEWKLKMELGKYVSFTSKIMAKTGSTTTATPAYVLENEFVPKHAAVKTATTAAGLTGATAISTIQSFTISVNPNLEADFGAGSNDPFGFSSRGYEMDFEMECYYTDTTYKTAFETGSALALQISLINTDVTIGTSAKPGLVLTAPKMNITDWALNEDLDSVVTQTMTGKIHYSPTDSYALKAILTSLQTAY